MFSGIFNSVAFLTRVEIELILGLAIATCAIRQ